MQQGVKNIYIRHIIKKLNWFLIIAELVAQMVMHQQRHTGTFPRGIIKSTDYATLPTSRVVAKFNVNDYVVEQSSNVL